MPRTVTGPGFSIGPRTVLERSWLRGQRDGLAGLAVFPARPALRLARRHQLSKARGAVLGVVSGLVVWSLLASFLSGMF